MTQRNHLIRPPDLKCSFENVVYLLTCKTCSKQFTGSTEVFRPKFNIDVPYRCVQKSFLKSFKKKNS